VVFTWNYIWFWTGCGGSWIWKNVLKLELKGLKISNKLAQTLTPIKPPNKFYDVKIRITDSLKMEEPHNIGWHLELGIFVGFWGKFLLYFWLSFQFLVLFSFLEVCICIHRIDSVGTLWIIGHSFDNAFQRLSNKNLKFCSHLVFKSLLDKLYLDNL
jgi:hypothetical protein